MLKLKNPPFERQRGGGAAGYPFPDAGGHGVFGAEPQPAAGCVARAYHQGRGAADKLLERLVNFSSDYRRNADYIEALALRSICLWRLKRTKESVAILTAAILKARELELIMPIIKNGGDILPVLRKMQNRLKLGYGADALDKAFVNILLMRSREISKHTPGMFSRVKSRPIKLSPKQSEVIGYLVRNLSYLEIGEKMGVTVDAVGYHIRVLHEKFDVSNSRDLLEKAEELGFADNLNPFS